MVEKVGILIGHQTFGSIPCCKCGNHTSNRTNMCDICFSSDIDITKGLQKHVIIMYCPTCNSYLQPPRTWIKAQLESPELKAFCLNRLNLKKVKSLKLVHAEFIWTEPHSKRIEMKLNIQKEVLNGVIPATYVVEYVVHDYMCESCSRIQANPDQWVAAVQLRQHVSHRRTFFYLEQLILKHGAALHAIKIKQMDYGIDFFFAKRSHGMKFLEFVGKVVPMKSRHDNQLVSHDTKSNNYNYRYTFSAEICPICREDLICLPPNVANSLGNPSPLVLCTKVSDTIVLLDLFTLRISFMNADQYWRNPFKSLLSSRQLVEYIVLNVESMISEVVNVRGSIYALANVEVARISDFGKNDKQFIARTHLGNLLKPGDYALGYDLYAANINDIEVDKYKGYLPDVILIKKSYEEKRQRRCGKPRSWKLKSMNMEVDKSSKKLNEERINAEYEEFLKDLEENPEMTFDISLYRNKEYQPSEMVSFMSDGEDLPLPLDELLAGLELSDCEDEDQNMEE